MYSVHLTAGIKLQMYMEIYKWAGGILKVYFTCYRNHMISNNLISTLGKNFYKITWGNEASWSSLYKRPGSFEHVGLQLHINTYWSLLLRFLETAVVPFLLQGQGWPWTFGMLRFVNTRETVWLTAIVGSVFVPEQPVFAGQCRRVAILLKKNFMFALYNPPMWWNFSAYFGLKMCMHTGMGGVFCLFISSINAR